MNQRFSDLSNEDYHDRDEIGSSQMKELLKSIAHFEWMKAHHKKPTLEMQKGSAVHIGRLEPHLFRKSVIAAPKWGAKKEDKAQKAAFLETHADKIILDEASFTEVCEMISCLEAHPTVNQLLSDGVAEHSFIWKDEDSGLSCRCRPDYLLNDSSQIIDLKTTKDASYLAFSKNILNLGYHISAAMYLDGVEAVEGVKPKEFLFIVIETKPPYNIAIYNLHPASIKQGRFLYRAALKRYANYLKKKDEGVPINKGYSMQVQDIQIPRWGFDQLPPIEEVTELKAHVGSNECSPKQSTSISV